MTYSFLDYCDLGCFQAGDLNPLNPRNRAASWLIHGEWIQGCANYMHAKMVWFSRYSWNGHNCAHCHVPIRYAIALRDGRGNVIVVGEDCATKLERSLNPEQWAEFKIMRKIKKAKNGHYCLSQEVPSGFWDIAPRPVFASLSKFRACGSKREKWYLSVWGESPFQVAENLKTLKGSV